MSSDGDFVRTKLQVLHISDLHLTGRYSKLGTMATLDKGGTVTLLEKRLDELAHLCHEIKDEEIRKEIEALSRRLTMARPTEE